MRLGTRLAVAFAVLVIIVASVMSVASLRAAGDELDNTVDGFLLARVGEITAGVRPNVVRGDNRRPPRFDGATERFSTDADSIVQTIRADGVVVNLGVALPVSNKTLELAGGKSSNGTDNDSDNIEAFIEDIEIDGEQYRMVTAALPEGGVVQVARNVEESQSILTKLGTQLFITATVIALLAAFVGWLVARRITRPVRRLSAVAADVAATRDLSVSIDVDGRDEVGELARSFRKMLDALEQSRDQQRRLVHDAGHELRTPITSLRANVEMLERVPDLPADDRAEIVIAIRAELVELSDLFDEMIDLASDQYSDEQRCDPILLAELVHRIAERWRRRTDRDIEVTADKSVVLGDQSRLDRAVSNLLSNAHKFSPPATPIEIVVAGGSVVVSDRGPGVPTADRARIFDRFHRTEATQAMSGSGLGLAIVAQIVDRHGGAVSVGEAASGGASIGFRLPLADAGHDGVDAVIRADPASSDAPVDPMLYPIAVEERHQSRSKRWSEEPDE